MGNVLSDSDDSDNEEFDLNKSNENSDDENSDDEILENKKSKKKNLNKKKSEDENLGDENLGDENLGDENLGDENLGDDNLENIVNSNWLPDTLDKDDYEFKIKHNLEFILHNFFLVANKKHLINLRKKDYNNEKETEYLKLLTKIHSSIIEGDDLIDDILENFPFEYQNINLEDKFQENTGLSVIDRVIDLLKFYSNTEHSKSYLTYNILNNENTSQDGLSIRYVLKLLNEHGICNEKYCSSMFEEPSKEAYKKAKFRNKIKYYRVKKNINDIKHLINQEKPIIFGISIYNKDLRLPKKQDKIIANQCLIIIGYKDEEREFIVKGDKIYNIKYDYILNKKLARDLWYFEII